VASAQRRRSNIRLAESAADCTVCGLQNYEELFSQITNGKGSIKVYCEVAA
jgi:hypothetical protein